MIKDFNEFVNENYILTIETDEEFDVKQLEWLDEFDVSDIWENYKDKKIGGGEFVREFNEKLIQKKDKLIEISKQCWSELMGLIDRKGKKFHTYLNEIYDWGDKYGIKIISEKNE